MASTIHVSGQAYKAALNAICAADAPVVAAASVAVAVPCATALIAATNFNPLETASYALCIISTPL